MLLSGLSNGTGNIYTDDKIDIEVTRPDGTKMTFSKNYGNGSVITPTAPQDITTYFKSGNNSIKVTMTDIAAPVCNSSEYWLVETTNGGGNIPAKPNILPRSTWKGDNSGVVISQTPNHIVVHHTRTSNDPGNVGTRARELQLAWALDKAGTVQNLFNPINVLNNKGAYSSIRDSWPGEAWLVWAEHKFVKNYGDIGYHYLIDQTGTIYEGRYKGTLGENADNKGSSIANANTGAVAISLLGRYGSDAVDTITQAMDGGNAEPTNNSINSLKNVVDWLAGKYNINKTASYQIPTSIDGKPSCALSPDQCFVNNIAGHKDFPTKTNTESTVCPGENLYKYLPTLRGQANLQATGTITAHKNPTGILIGGFSPVELGVVDPTGKRLGKNPTTGGFETGIPNGIYGKMFLFDNEDDSGETAPYWLHVPTTTSGVYKIDVVGTGTGPFTLATEDLPTSSARAMNGTTTAGKKDNYQIIYSTANPSQLELFHDTIPPVTTGNMTCSRDMNGTCRSNATVNLTATDTGTNGDPASGVVKIECSHDNKVTWQQCGTVSSSTLTFSKNEKKSFYYRAIDRVGNVEAVKFSGIIDVQQFIALADTSLISSLATNLETKGIAQSNGAMTFNNDTNVKLDIINHIGAFTQTGNTTFNYNQKNQITTPNPLPNYPLNYYKTACPNFTGPITISDTSPAYNKCMYVLGDVTFNATTPTGKLTIVSEGFIRDNSTNANLQAWDTKNGILFYSAKGYTSQANGAIYTGVIYAPTTKIDGAMSNTTLNGGLYSKTVSFGADTSLKAFQAAGFPATTHTFPL